MDSNPPYCIPIDSYSLFGPVHVPAEYLRQAIEMPDAVAVALELGRLDLATLILTCVGIFLAAGAVVGFWVLRGQVKDTAREEIQAICGKEVEGYLSRSPDVLLTSVRSIIEEQLELKLASLSVNGIGGSRDFADQVAQAAGADDG